MPIGFVRSEEEEDTWIAMLVKHILSCKDVNCFRCAEAVHHHETLHRLIHLNYNHSSTNRTIYSITFPLQGRRFI